VTTDDADEGELLLAALSTAVEAFADADTCEDAVDALIAAKPPVCATEEAMLALTECESDDPELLAGGPEDALGLEDGRETDCDESTVDEDSDVWERLVWEETETDDEPLCTPTEDDSTIRCVMGHQVSTLSHE
jgi:hypothetical protein